ncbi:AMP-binding protein [Mycolicibacterium sp. BiH015]|uniref:AMP-binding protein n=1 Tax=Mycolicibacterium sp. BiH015 TaxID=3018808 RepID=UPI0022E268B2|nr:AMP-binding protein [Mycolicibacterium sp. BiH015]MDA2889432.1 AMP-binding protein [Mycolicibacterium sp. BiH015]
MDLAELTVGRFLEQAVDEVPDDPLLIWDERQVSYREFDENANRAANVWHDLGVRRGDHVAFMVDNKPEFLYAWFGLAKLGATLVAVNTGFKERETHYILEHSQAKFVLVDDVYADIIAPSVGRLPGLEAVYAMQAGAGFPYFGELMDRASATAPEPSEVSPDDVVSFIYTSGTTGNPKAVMQSQRNFVLTGQAYPHWMRMEKGDRIYACLPLFHINSQAYSMMGAIGARGAIVLARRFSANRFWDDIRRHKVAVFNFIGAMTLILSKKEPADDDLDHSVKVAYGVPALPGELRETLEKRYGMTVISGFGMSETTFGLLEPFDERRRAGAMGFPRQHPDPAVPRTEAAVVDENGNHLGDNEVGELILRGPAHMLGYFHDPEKTAEALRDGWLFTGDMARRDIDGQYYFVDRKKDIVRRRGENVSSLEVENVINEHPAVLESAVIGVPSDLTDEDLMVFIVARDGAELDFGDIGDWAAERLARFKVPRYYRQIDALPKTSTQKIAKHQLRSAAEEKGYDRDFAASAR